LELQLLNAQVTRRLRQFREEVHTREQERRVLEQSAQTPSPGKKQKKALSKPELIEEMKRLIGETIRKQLLVDFAEETTFAPPLSEIVIEDGERNTTASSVTEPSALEAAVASMEEQRAETILSVREQTMYYALNLDFARRPRLSRSGEIEIEVHKRKQAIKEDRNRALQYALLWGYSDPRLSPSERRRVAKAACSLVGYDHGYMRPLSHNQLPAWLEKMQKALGTGECSTDSTLLAHAGSHKYVDYIEAAFPGYIRELFRYATVGRITTTLNSNAWTQKVPHQ
jgi:hypothetical protein